MTAKLLDWRLRRVRTRSGLPDTPEMRRFMRAAWWNGFTFGAAYRRELPALREAARSSLERDPS